MLSEKHDLIKGVSVVAGPLLPAFIDAQAYFKHHKKILDFKANEAFIVYSNHVYTSYFSKEEIDNTKKYIEKGGLKRVKENIALFYKGLGQLEQWSRRKRKKPSEMANAGLRDTLNSFIAASDVAPSIPYMRSCEKILCNKISSRINDEYIQKLTTPHDIESVIIKERRHLLEIAYAVKRKKAPADDMIREHVSMFGWSTTHVCMGNPLSFNDVKASLQQLLNQDVSVIEKNIAELNNNLQTISIEKKSIIKNLKLSAEEKEIIDILNDFARIKIITQDEQSYSMFIFMSFLKEIASRIGLSKENAEWLLPEEIITCLADGKKPSSLIKRIISRKKSYVLSLSEDYFKLLEGKKAKEFIDGIKDEKLDLKELKGQTGFKGKATGRAVVVKSIKDFKKVKKGQILITTTTTPQFIPILKLVKAIVTDSGGITSHAAIVSREMKIPCVLGTRNATDNIKDDELIEVDADKGIVRRIR